MLPARKKNDVVPFWQIKVFPRNPAEPWFYRTLLLSEIIPGLRRTMCGNEWSFGEPESHPPPSGRGAPLTSIITNEMPWEWTSLRNKMNPRPGPFFYSLFFRSSFSKVFRRRIPWKSIFLPQHPQQAVLLWQFQANTAEGMGINIPKATLLLPFIAGSSFPRIHYSSGPGLHTQCRSTECNRHRVDFQIIE